MTKYLIYIYSMETLLMEELKKYSVMIIMNLILLNAIHLMENIYFVYIQQ